MLKKLLVLVLTGTVFLGSMFVAPPQAKAASLVEYSLLVKLISGLTAPITPSQIDRTQTCYQAAERCKLAEMQAEGFTGDYYLSYAKFNYCRLSLASELGRAPTSEELNTKCAREIAVIQSAYATISPAKTLQTKACEYKAVVCNGL